MLFECAAGDWFLKRSAGVGASVVVARRQTTFLHIM